MENEENIGLINKKVSQDELARFWLSFGAMKGKASKEGKRNEGESKEGRRKEGASKEERDQATTTRLFVGINLHVCFPC